MISYKAALVGLVGASTATINQTQQTQQPQQPQQHQQPQQPQQPQHSQHSQQPQHSQQRQRAQQPHQRQASLQRPTASTSSAHEVIDIGINITSPQLKGMWRELVEEAEQAGVAQILLTGTCIKSSRESLKIARCWASETKRRTLYCTVGVHPHSAKSFDAKHTIADMQHLLSDELAVAVGECGLDYNRMFSSRTDQMVRLKSCALLRWLMLLCSSTDFFNLYTGCSGCSAGACM